jgi:hypothetical protein
MSIQQRLKQTTPRFFKKIRNIGLALAAAGTALLTAPVALPAAVISIAGYLVVAGSVAAAVSQATTPGEEKKEAHGE